MGTWWDVSPVMGIGRLGREALEEALHVFDAHSTCPGRPHETRLINARISCACVCGGSTAMEHRHCKSSAPPIHQICAAKRPATLPTCRQR
jgi:hypothetical protein